MRKANVGDPRNGEPSMRALAEKSGESPETIRRMVRGLGDPQPATVASVAEALGVSTTTIAKWVGLARKDAEDSGFTPYYAADLMTHDERELINALIATLVRDRISSSSFQPSTATKRIARKLDK
jgi:transposase-like protein